MIFRTLIAPAFAAMTAIQPVTAMPQIPNGYEFINDASDGELYFGKSPAMRHKDLAFLRVFSVEPDGTTHEWTQVMNCKNKTYQSENDGWEPIDPKTVGIDWFVFACN